MAIDPDPEDDDDVETLPVDLDRDVRLWLAEQARATGVHPRVIAASIIKDVVQDDRAAHAVH